MSSVIAKNHQVGNSLTSTDNLTIYQPSTPDGTLRIGAGNAGATTADLVTLTSAGNLGIGTASNLLSAGNRVTVSVNGVSSSALAFGTSDTRRGHLYCDSGELAVASASGVISLQTSGATRATIDASGNVGIGITLPTARLNVVDNQYGANAGGAAVFIRQASAAGNNGVVVDVTNSVGQFIQDWRMGNSSVVRIDSSGNLLVGTTSANGRLSIDSAGTTSATYIIFGRNSAATNKFTVRSDGAGFLDAAAWTYGSDATIKENIEYLNPSNCLSLILNAKPAKFDYIDGQKSNYGYIAQDVQTWLPEAVSETPNGKLGLQDGFINAVGTGAIQALNSIIQEQQALITSLTARIAALEAR